MLKQAFLTAKNKYLSSANLIRRCPTAAQCSLNMFLQVYSQDGQKRKPLLNCKYIGKTTVSVLHNAQLRLSNNRSWVESTLTSFSSNTDNVVLPINCVESYHKLFAILYLDHVGKLKCQTHHNVSLGIKYSMRDILYNGSIAKLSNMRHLCKTVV